MKVEYECATCGVRGTRRYARNRVTSQFFCSVPCQNEWQKSRKDLIEKNKDPEFRKKVSAGLRRRKEALGENYHSPETKAKIGAHTSCKWREYSDSKRQRLTNVLRQNAQAMRTYGPYDYHWQQLSQKLRKRGICRRCGSRRNLIVHHIIPTKCGGERWGNNLAVLCRSCHPKVEAETKRVYELIGDWGISQLLIQERLHLCP